MIKRLAVAALFLALAGTGCQLPGQADFGASSGSPDASWQEAGTGVSRYECPPPRCPARLILFRFAKNSFSWRFAQRRVPSTVQAWTASLPKAVFVANGVFFDENWQPTGLLKIGGEKTNDRNYDPELSGMLELSPEVRVIDTAAEKYDLAKMTEAGQSFPLLVKKGVAVSSFKDAHAARRTVIGTDKKGDVYVGAVPEDAITFADLAALLAETGVEWDNVINLDGGTSTGFALRGDGDGETMNSIVQVPNVIVAERK